MSGIATAIIGGVGMIASLGMGIHNKNKAEREARKMERLQKKEAQRLKREAEQAQRKLDAAAAELKRQSDAAAAELKRQADNAAEALRLKEAADALKKAGKKANPKNWF